MEILIVCAGCHAEYKALADNLMWACTSCGREIENKNYPFLTRRVAHAKSHRDETQWQEMFDEVLAAAHEKVVALESRVAKLEEENRRLRGQPAKRP